MSDLQEKFVIFKKFRQILLTKSIRSCLLIRHLRKHFPGGYREGETPVPIPNTEVKPLIADGTALVMVWESRTLPGLI